MLERAPQEKSGGTAILPFYLWRVSFHLSRDRGPEVDHPIIPDLSKDEIPKTDFGTYTEDQCLDDMYRMTRFRTDLRLGVFHSTHAPGVFRRRDVRYA
jgi:tricarballylate dehydrogenase